MRYLNLIKNRPKYSIRFNYRTGISSISRLFCAMCVCLMLKAIVYGCATKMALKIDMNWLAMSIIFY